MRAAFLLCALFASVLTAAPVLRIATYNASLNRNTEGRLVTDLSNPENSQAKQVAEIVQRLAPDIILINEFDYDADHEALDLFHDNYLAVSQNNQPAQNYPHRFTAPSNTGIPTDFAFDFGFGNFPGQFGLAVYSKFPIRLADVRTFQKFLWKDMPQNLIPTDFYSTEEQDIFRLSSKSHWDLPIEINGTLLHLLVSHPTPPVFDGPEDRNGKRNHDEIRLWADYLSNSSYIYDDADTFGGLPPGSRFVILGDQNADPVDGDSVNGAITQLLEHPSVADPQPRSIRNGTDTAAFSSESLRVDYVLPSKAGFEIDRSGVYWPTSSPGINLITASDHRPVWVDLILTPLPQEAFENLTLTNQPIALTWTANSNLTYTVETSTDLSAESWQAAETTITFDGTSATAPLPATPADITRFYRLRASYP